MLTDLLQRVIETPQTELCQLQGFDSYLFAPSGAAYTKATVAQNGQIVKIKVYQGSGQQLTQAQIGHLLQFSLKSYQAQNSKIYISGFWNDRATPQQMAQNPPQSAPRTVQATNAPNPARDATGLSGERQCVVRAVAEIVARRAHMDVAEAMEWAVTFHDWIATGKVRFEATHEPVNAPNWDPEDQDPNDGCPV